MNFAQTFNACIESDKKECLKRLLRQGKLSAGDIAGHFDVVGSDHFPIIKPPQAGRFNSEEKRRIFIYYELEYFCLGGFNGLAIDLKGDSAGNLNKKLLLLTSMVILFPMLWGLMIWSACPRKSRFTSILLASPITSNRGPGCVLEYLFSISWCILFMIFMIGRDSKNSASEWKTDQSDLLVEPQSFPYVSPISSIAQALGSTTNPSVFCFGV